MSTLSTFQINQPPGTPYGTWDRARRDIDLYSVGSEKVECEALEKAQTTYLWEMTSAPDGVSVTINNPTTHTCDFQINTTGSYLIRLTVNAGAPNESENTLFFGVTLPNTNKCLPALNETNQDNSQSPYTGVRGNEDKINAMLRVVDDHHVASGRPVDASGFSGVLSVSEDTAQKCFDKIDARETSSPSNTVTIDIENGTDAVGRGKPESPYKTLPYAIAQVGQPADAADYQLQRTFVLKKGTYPGNAVLPTYHIVSLILEEAMITGDLDWDLDPIYLYGLDPGVYRPILVIMGQGAGPAVTNIHVKNDDPDAGELANKMLFMQDVQLFGHLINKETGHATVASGTLTAVMDNVISNKAPAVRRLGGMYESVIGIATAPNSIILKLRGCDLTRHTICGCTQLAWASDTQFRNADYRMDPITGSTSYTGIVEGLSDVNSEGLVGSWWNIGIDSWFGSATVTPNIFTGDAYSMRWFFEASGYTFTGFAADSDQPFDWWRMRDRAEGVEVDESKFSQYLNGMRSVQECFEKIDGTDAYNSDAVITVSSGVNHVANGANLLAAYTAAKALTPGGNALAVDNRALLIVPQGVYDLGSQTWTMNEDFVDVVGFGKSRNFNRWDVVTPGTIVTSGTGAGNPVIDFTARDFQIKSVTFKQSGNGRDIAHISNSIYYCDKAVFTDLALTYASGVTVSGFALIGTLGADSEIHGYWENCHAGRLSGIAQVPFGHESKMTGKFVDCSGGDFSFGGVAAGGHKASFDGIAIRCTAGDNSFGSTFDQNTICGGTLIDCVAGSYSFGYDASNTAGIGGVLSGQLTRCKGLDYCFGATSDVNPDGTTVCSGILVDCEALDHSFGGRYGDFSGDANRCVGGAQCFGGEDAAFTGKAVGCEAGDASFGSGNDSSGTLIRCRSVGRTVSLAKWMGLIQSCEFEVVTALLATMSAKTGLRIYDTLLVAGAGASYSIDADKGNPQDIKMAHCRLSHDIDSATPITNLINNGYNAVDTDFAV